MTVINLDPDFKPFGEGERFAQLDFPSGCEPHIKLGYITNPVFITHRIKSSTDLMRLLLATDAVKRSGATEVNLFIPYLPFARQDRVMVPGEPLSVKVICDIINLQGYSEVKLFDPHSEVCLALLNNVRSLSNHHFVSTVLNGKTDYLIVSPDAGAYKKIFKLCQYLNYTDEIVLCNKTRNVSTGEITSVTCEVKDFKGKDLYIVDDICDGGGTFILLAAELKKRNCGKINLIVSHGIFSKGVALEGIDHVYATDSFKDFESDPKLTQTKLCSILS